MRSKSRRSSHISSLDFHTNPDIDHHVAILEHDLRVLDLRVLDDNFRNRDFDISNIDIDDVNPDGERLS